ncbi:MAG: filamentous hemagglutinin N-terminal domain-containing protein, partial [Prochlorotrichaceae cyanobacterium]
MIMQHLKVRSLGLGITLSGALVGIEPGFAQIIPDATLGEETSRLSQETSVDGVTTAQISGGAVRQSLLFHSFLDFNVRSGEKVYFSSPGDIQAIFSRVTGTDSSLILGTLGVAGNADLFLLNPHGILFGSESRLDIPGSFVASTDDAFRFDNGLEFSSVNPVAPPLLQVNLQPGLQWGLRWGENREGGINRGIESLGDLTVGKDLSFQTGNLVVQGTLKAGENISLQADQMRLTDTIDRPLRIIAGGNLTLEGQEQVMVSALAHPESWLYGGNGLVLRSSQAIVGDGYFYSGGEFRVENLQGDLNSLLSPEDPIIRTLGDVSLGSYTGSSLHIIAGGSVTIAGTTRILGGATEDASDFLQETITLSDGTIVNIDGAARPTLDIRAGVSPDRVGLPDVDCAVATCNLSSSPTGGNISLSRVVLGTNDRPAFDAQIFLTNQYFPVLPGAISLGQITSRSRGIDVGQVTALVIDGSQQVNLGSLNLSITNPLTDGNGDPLTNRVDGGQVKVLAGDVRILGFDLQVGTTIVSVPGLITTASALEGRGGEVTIVAQGDLTNQFNPQGSIQTDGTLGGGRVVLTSGGAMNLAGTVIADSLRGIGGDLNLTSGGHLSLSETALLRSEGLQGGAIRLSSTAGDLLIQGSGFGTPSILSRSNLQEPQGSIPGQGGAIQLVAAGQIDLTNGAQIFTQNAVNGIANLGSITLTAGDTIRFSGKDSAVSTQVNTDATGLAGDIELVAHRIDIQDDAQLTTATLGGRLDRPGSGDAGDIRLTADEIRVTG